MFRKIACSLFGITFTSTCFLDGNTNISSERNAICILYPQNSNTRGVISFSQENLEAQVKIVCAIKGLKQNSKHGIHIHQFGDLTQGCATAGPHYNPHNKHHGGPHSQTRHVGDLGNLHSDQKGNCSECFTDNKISLFGNYSIVGRSVVVHANQDDLGQKGDEQSLKTGNSGPRIACGVIGLCKQFKNLQPRDL